MEATAHAVEEVRASILKASSEKSSGAITADTKRMVQRSLMKLRRAHFSLRESQLARRKQVLDVASKLRKVQSQMENSAFIDAQCEFLVAQNNAAHFPELEQVAASLPSVEDYTASHSSSDPSFVSYESDPHQFMLNMLTSELTERHELEQKIKTLEQDKNRVKSEIANRKQYLSLLSGRLSDLNRSVDGLAKLLNTSP